MQCACDSNCKILSISSILTSSSHDSNGYEHSAFSDVIRNNLLPAKYNIVMDSAYICGDQELTPWAARPKRQAFEDESERIARDAFNYLLSRQRQVCKIISILSISRARAMTLSSYFILGD